MRRNDRYSLAQAFYKNVIYQGLNRNNTLKNLVYAVMLQIPLANYLTDFDSESVIIVPHNGM